MDQIKKMRPVEGVVHVVQNGRAVLLDTERGTYFGLNPVGADIWAQILQGQDFDDVVTAVASEYKIAESEVRLDVVKFVDSLKDNNLVEIDA